MTIRAKTTFRRSGNLRLNGLSSVDPGDQMIIGGRYTFNFTQTGVGTSLDSESTRQAILTDSNFKAPAVAVNPGNGLFQPNQVQVVFTYAGRGSDVQSAGAEMQQVISSHFLTKSVRFDSADLLDAGSSGAAPTVAPTGNPITDAVNRLQIFKQQQASLPSLFQVPSFGTAGFGWGTILTVGGIGLLGTVAAVKAFNSR